MFETIRNWFKTFEPKEVKVPGLGRLHNDRYGNWLGKKTIQPIGHEVELLFRTGPEPPDEKAAQFVREVEDQFPRLCEEVGKQVFADLSTWEDGTTMPELFESLSITDFCFWELSSSPREWEIYCTTEKVEGALIHIRMRDFEYFDVSMDT